MDLEEALACERMTTANWRARAERAEARVRELEAREKIEPGAMIVSGNEWERAHARIEALEGALRGVVFWHDAQGENIDGRDVEKAWDRARAALAAGGEGT